MPASTILFADNDIEFLQTRADYLEREGYRLIQCSNITEAQRAALQGGIDLAILDVRLTNDDDEKDDSGISLAKELSPTLPKIMLTAFPNFNHVRETMRSVHGYTPLAVDYVAKSDGLENLLKTVQRVLGQPNWIKNVQQKVAMTDSDLKLDYEATRWQMIITFFASFIVALIGIVIIFIGIYIILFTNPTQVNTGVITSLSGIVANLVSILFYRRVDSANQRMDNYHNERMRGQRFATLLQACDGISAQGIRDVCRQDIILAASKFWVGAPQLVHEGVVKEMEGRFQ